jgi:hypothetical protein
MIANTIWMEPHPYIDEYEIDLPGTMLAEANDRTAAAESKVKAVIMERRKRTSLTE